MHEHIPYLESSGHIHDSTLDVAAVTDDRCKLMKGPTLVLLILISALKRKHFLASLETLSPAAAAPTPITQDTQAA